MNVEVQMPNEQMTVISLARRLFPDQLVPICLAPNTSTCRCVLYRLKCITRAVWWYNNVQYFATEKAHTGKDCQLLGRKDTGRGVFRLADKVRRL